MEKNTLVLGASENPRRYSNLAIIRLRQKNYPVTAIGKRKGKVADVEISDQKKVFENIHTVTIYLNKSNQEGFTDYIIKLNPKRVIFNPGAENADLENQAKAQGITPINACTLVMLRTGQF